MAIWLCRADLEDATSVSMVATVFDDDQNGQTNTRSLEAVIRRAEAQVMSRIVVQFGPPPIPAAKMAQLKCDDFLKFAALDYAVAYMFDKHPEYVRTGMQKDRESRMKSANDQMTRFLDAEQQPNTVVRPANVGGAVVDGAVRVYIDNPDGTRNSGDYIHIEESLLFENTRPFRRARWE